MTRFEPTTAALTPRFAGIPSFMRLPVLDARLWWMSPWSACWSCWRGLRRGTIVGVDLVETAPDDDPAGVTSILAAQLLLNLIGRIFARR